MAISSSLDISWPVAQKRRCKPLGFRNLGNSCYLNSVLQCLTYTPPLANFCLRGLHTKQCDVNNELCPFCLLETRIVRSLRYDSPVDAPSKIFRCLQVFAKHFRPGRQEDAHELLRYAIDTCDDVCRRLQKNGLKGSSQTVMRDIFGGVLQNQIRCLSCSGLSTKLDVTMDLSLDITRAKTLEEAISNFFQPEVLDGSNKYQCHKCGKLSVARKQLSFHQSPNVLVVQLMRFENFLGGKIDRHVEFEEKLKLKYQTSKHTLSEYSLYAVVVHSGQSQYSGHYYAFVKDPSAQWYCCNDSFISSVSSASVLSESAYILFYIRDLPKSEEPKDDHLSSGSSTPSPPPTPDSVLLPPINPACPPIRKEQQPKVTFSILKRDKMENPKPVVNAHNTITSSTSNTSTFTSIVPETPDVSSASIVPETPDVSSASIDPETPKVSTTVADATKPSLLQAAGTCESMKPLPGHKRRREEIEAQLKEFSTSSEFQALKRRLETEGRERLKQSGWCEDVRKSFREVKNRSNADYEAWEKTLETSRRAVPASVKEHLVKQLKHAYATERRIV